ncbi:TetR family transcriptional regulator [Pseudomonas chlororaphis]|uniref:TetR family transcriptional regulator n=1 Tax=Pseudomonas chlororaphis TaxID=587753 RepID=UPI00026E4958|nr:TetR family transcriptional regulator [Pseudomonas chlororaphis]EJL07071.1 transcriptional regulator, TetR family [Pseudomonas chlororaphis subsp. aureofaciens 30-84]
MRVTKMQAQENRAHIVKTASRLFRERGYDGVGVADLMSAAGFTHGGFYKHFKSKADLMAVAATCGLSHSSEQAQGVGIPEFVNHYLSRAHRDNPGQGCTVAALGGDAARQEAPIKAAFEEGIEQLLASFAEEEEGDNAIDERARRAKLISTFAHSIGAIVLSRACPDDSLLADEILEVCRAEILI